MNVHIDRKIILVKRKSRLDELVTRFNSIAQARFYIEHLGADFSDYQQEHEEYHAAVQSAYAVLHEFARVQVLDREFLPNFLFGEEDVVVAIGQDGLVANTMKYLSGQQVVGVNPSPRRWDGVLLPFQVQDLRKVIPEVFRQRRKCRKIVMAQVTLNDGQSMLAVNDFFIGQQSHVSARYRIFFGHDEENQSSSGIIVSTGLGSTGWLKSILAGSAGIVVASGESELRTPMLHAFQWDSEYLYFSVREPFPSKTTGTSIVFGKVNDRSPLRIRSHMAEKGVIFSDGIEADFLEFNSGSEAVISLADKKGWIVV